MHLPEVNFPDTWAVPKVFAMMAIGDCLRRARDSLFSLRKSLKTTEGNFAFARSNVILCVQGHIDGNNVTAVYTCGA